LLGRVGKQAEHTERDAEGVAERLARERQRRAQRGRPRTGERVDCPQQWTEDLVQSRERELGFGLHRHRAQNRHPGRPARCVGEQSRLADSDLAAHDQHTTSPGSSVIEKAADRLGLPAPPDKHRSSDRNSARTGAHDWRSP
jgi:hypothetical protein